MMTGQRELFVTFALLALASNIEAFLPCSCRNGIKNLCSRPLFIRQLPSAQLAAKKDDDDEEEATEPGMADAFRQLDGLESLDDASSVAPQTSKDAAKGFQKPAMDAKTPSVEKASPEKEAQLYSEMAKELDETNEDSLYSDVLSEMGGSAPSPKSSPKLDVKPDAPAPSENDTEEFLNQALDQAMKEVKLNNPSVTDSILDDKEIMKEIEAIFERGNEKLLESLEEVRKEQQDLARESAAKNAQKGMDRMEDDAKRLVVAEKSMEAMLNKVNKETAEVERAVEDLKTAQAEIEKDPLFKLRSGGIVKQGALVGFLLFSVRSIIDSVAAISDESHLPAALLQGVIAMACAAYFFLF